MNLIRIVLGRRQFLIAFVVSTLKLAFGRTARAFDVLFQTDTAKASEQPGSGKGKRLKGIVVFYSATGNTAQAVNEIYKGMKSMIACDVAPITKVKPADMAKYDVMALVSPNWFMRVPGNVLAFTQDMPRMDGKHCIIFGTHGGTPVAQFWIMSRNILKKGMTIIGWSDWYGSDFMTPHSSVPDSEWGHPDEIDLAEAEAFGRKMAEYSKRIYDGEKGLIPEIPKPEKGVNSLWSPYVSNGNITFADPPPNSIPRFDLTKCIYPRCTQCIENCPVHAIDFSMIAPADSIDPPYSITSPIVTKEACQHCGGLCKNICQYDAIDYEGGHITIEINMKKCTYPKCTICADECPMDNIDFSVNPPIIHNHCEGEGLCWGVCPENAVEVPNMAEIQLKKAWWFRVSGKFSGPGSGQGAGAEGPGMMTREGPTPRFRNLVKNEDREQSTQVMFITNYPRVPLNKNLWPYEVGEG